jgi:membrane fusion protein (multidrug efflux system)
MMPLNRGLMARRLLKGDVMVVAEVKRTRLRVILTRMVTAIGFLVVVVLLLAWLAGAFHHKIGTGPSSAAVLNPIRTVGTATCESAKLIRVPRTESAVGTVRAVHETSVASRLLARVTTVTVTAGQRVSKDEVLVALDDVDLRARLRQAEAAVTGAKAVRDQARIEYERIKELVAKESAAKIEWDRVQTALSAAEADLLRAEEAVNEAGTFLSFATIRSPIDGIVIDKKIEVGDTVTPGQTLATVLDPTHMQLVASVRESLTRRLRVGQTIGVHLDALDKTCEGQISEIVPEAESASRTFSVKATGPCPPGIYSGMFGRLLIPLDEDAVLVVPRAAVRRVGQLDLINVAEQGAVQRRAVQLGRTFGDHIEVLSGLREGEQVVSAHSAPHEGAGE